MSTEYFNRDMELFLDHRVDWSRRAKLRGGDRHDATEERDVIKTVLRTAAEVCADIGREAREHWHEEVELVDGETVVPKHIAAGYEKLRSAGLLCLPLGAEHGGYGLPMIVNCMFLEMLARADASLMTIVGLQTGCAKDIERYASEEINQRYQPEFASGALQGAMDLTEPEAGSDLGGIRTRMTTEDGSYYVDGEKVFITNGGADVHLVLARDDATFNETRGTTKGLSLLLCPRVLPDGAANGVLVRRVERKQGIHGSPTCVVDFEHAKGYLLGESGQGFRFMLDLMNDARLGVAAQALGIAEGAYREARQYAKERVQFSRPIIEQPLVKSMLTVMAINIQAARALLYRTCALVDTMEDLRAYLSSEIGRSDPVRDGLEQERERSLHLVRFLTPLCKYYATEISTDATRRGIQVHGGIGFMADSAAGHYHSDAMITTIYEGTSEIQASFALREMSKGTLVTALDDVRAQLESVRTAQPELVEQVCTGIQWINDALPALMTDPQYALLNAKRISQMVIDVLVSAELLIQAGVSEEKEALATAFVHRHMLNVERSAKRIATGDASRIAGYDRILGL